MQFVRNLYTSDNLLVLFICEGTVLLKLSEISEAFELMLGLYYMLNIQYKKGDETVYHFFQKFVVVVTRVQGLPQSFFEAGFLC